MVEQKSVQAPKGIRWGDLEQEIAEAAKEDERTFSQEARLLVRLGLERRRQGGTP